MSQQGLSLDEEVHSPDIFSDSEVVHSPELQNLDESNYTSSPGVSESDLMEDVPEWKGISMDEIYKGLGPFGYQQHPPISPSENHTVLFLLPLTGRGPPKPYPTSHNADKWCVGYVRMPHSSHSLYPIEHSNGTREFRLRWEVIQEALLQSFISSTQFETAVLSYNNKYAQRWDFCALHHFFTEVMEEEETGYFFSNLLPKIIQLALQLPALVTGPIPLLRTRTNGCISFSQLQVAALLANAFLCTFPRRNSTNPQSEYAAYPYINFNRLFSAYREDRPNRSHAVMEKLKCLCHYFRRVTTKAPEGTITIQRRYIPKADCPQWDKLDDRLPLLHITSKGTIETEGAGLLQVDFANKYVGGGVLNWGCVQEEIRFVICPELMVTMLVTEALDDTEALIVSGIERYSKYEGYSNNFTWTGDFVDETPRDNSGRRRTSVVAIDALNFRQPNTQFSKENLIRELNKAYVGFSSSEMSQDNLPAIATGNWGCGAFRGNPKLKVLLQLMAAAVAGRSMVYFTFGDTNLRDSVADMYWHLVQRNMEIAQLFSLLLQYENASPSARSDFYRFLYNRSRIKSLTSSFLQRSSSNISKRYSEFSNESLQEIVVESRNLKDKEKRDEEKLVKTEAEKRDNNGEPKEEKQISIWDMLRDQELKSKRVNRRCAVQSVEKIEKKEATKETRRIGEDLFEKNRQRKSPKNDRQGKSPKNDRDDNEESKEEKEISLWDVFRDQEIKSKRINRKSAVESVGKIEKREATKESQKIAEDPLNNERQEKSTKNDRQGKSTKNYRQEKSTKNDRQAKSTKIDRNFIDLVKKSAKNDSMEIVALNIPEKKEPSLWDLLKQRERKPPMQNLTSLDPVEKHSINVSMENDSPNTQKLSVPVETIEVSMEISSPTRESIANLPEKVATPSTGTKTSQTKISDFFSRRIV